MRISKKDDMSKLKDLEWFCPQPFMNTVMNYDLIPKSCCVIKDWPDQDFLGDTGQTSIMEVHNSDFMKDFRKEFLNGGGPISDKLCLVCKVQEKHSSTESHRLTYLDKFVGKKGEYREHLAALEDYIDTDQSDPMYLTFEYNAPNNFCNLKCNMCKPRRSSTLAKENKAIGVGNGALRQETWINIQDDMSKYEPILKNLIELKLVGGETLALPQNYEMMDKAIEMGVSKQMKIVMTTNATLTPKMGKHGDVFDYVPYFKDCQMNISVECWGEKNNYIRFPSKWEKIMENVERFSKMPRTEIMFATCVSSLTIGYLHEVAEGVDAMIEKQPDIFKDFANGSLVIGGDNLYTVTAIPPDIRELYLEKIYKHATERHIKTFMKLANYLTDMPFDEILHIKMMIDVAKRDKFRGTVLTDVFPEWEPYYEKL
jgi:hypothetical protein